MAESIMLSKIKAFEKDYALIKDPFKQVDALVTFCWDYMDSMIYTDLCYQKIQLCGEILKTIDYPKGEAGNLSSLCFYSWAKSKHADTIKYGQQAISLYKRIGDKEGEGACLTLISYVNMSLGNYDEAFKNNQDSLKLMHDLPASVKKAWTYYNLAILYFETKDYAGAIKGYEQAIIVSEEINFGYGVARGLSFIGTICINQGKFDEARDYISKAIVLYREAGHDIGLSRALNDLGVICRKLGQYKEAETYLKECYELRKAVNHTQGLITTTYELGELLIASKKTDEALELLHKALDLAVETNTRTKVFQIQKAIAEAYKLKGDYSNAYKYLEQFIEVQSTVLGQESAQRLKQMQTRAATEKADKEAEIERLKNVELKQANDIIATKNKEIVDSINYAWRIQSALLAADKLLKDNLEDFFVLFKPKDIVSGDFYWATKKDNRFYIAVCDSTGHGVPGAFMSILNVSYMNEAISEKGISAPNEVFNHVRQRLIENISQDGQQDGMDGILLCVEDGKTTYAAAFNTPLLINKKGITEFGTDKMPVGKGVSKEPFSLRTIETKKGDMLYLYTDGYADQFGGPNGKKFKYKAFEELLVTIRELPLEEQKATLDKKFSEWKGELEQVDDVLVVGIRLN
jgi:serine phosphatase RsbU (regulator of sigma subunit)